MLVKLQSAIALLTCGCLVSVAASPSSVGFVVTNGQAEVDGSVIHGNSTLFQGSLIRTGSATSDLMFPGGSNLLLQTDSAVKVYREYALLQRGAVIQRGSHGVVANGLRIYSLSAQGAIVVGMKDASHLEVAAQGGPAEVRTVAGALVARLDTGKAMSFTVQDSPQTSAASQQTSGPASLPPGTQLTLHGIVRKDHAGRYGHYLLTDVLTKVTYELQGPGLDELVGAQVEVIGSIFDQPAAEGASRVVSVSDIHQMPLSELPGATTATAPPTTAPPATPPSPSPEEPPAETTAPPSTPGPDVAATPEAQPAPDVSTTPAIPPLPTHSDLPKILLIVGLAAGAVVGVALGLGGGKSSTISPA